MLLEEHQGRPAGPDRARRVGADVRGRPQVPPTPAPSRGFRGPLRCTWDLAVYVLGAGWTPVVPLRYTHPAPYPTRIPTLLHPSDAPSATPATRAVQLFLGRCRRT